MRTNALISLTLGLLIASPVGAAFLLEAEANPDPVEPNQMLDTQITVSTNSSTGNLTLQVIYPGELNVSPVVTGGGTCPGGGCDGGEILTWNLGTLDAGASVTVSFNETVRGNTVDGTLIALDVELLEGGIEVKTLSLSIEVQTDSPLEISLDPLPDPVAPSATLVYELIYANTGVASAEDTVLDFPVPAGTVFDSATGDGVFGGGTVSWDLGSLAPNSGGRERVTVQVDALPIGFLLLVDAATLSGEVNFQSREGRAMAVSRVAEGSLALDLEANPDRVEPGQLLDTQITVSNLTVATTGTLTLRVLWPEELNVSPVIAGGGDCPGGGCDPGEYLSWDLGVLGPAVSKTVSFNETVRGTTDDGTLIPLEVELLEGGLPARNDSHTVITQSVSPLEIAVEPLPDPVASEATLVYELIYSNTGVASSEDTILNFPVPAGTVFTSATGDGIFADGTVSWDFGSLAPNTGGRVYVTVQVDALADGTLVVVDAATLSGDVNFLSRVARALAVSRVAVGPLALDLEANPDRVEPGQMMDTQITVSNLTGSATGTLTLRVLWPEELNVSPIITGGGTCPGGGCDPGEYLSWDLGVLGPAVSKTVSFNETVRGTTEDGTLIPLEVELLEGGLPARNDSHTLITQTDSPLEIAVEPLPDPVASGGTLIYEIVYGNAGVASSEDTVLDFSVPAGTVFTSATGGGVLADGTVSWDFGSLAADTGGREYVTVQVDALADGTLVVVDAATLSGDINFLSRVGRALAVSRVAVGPLALDLVVDPNPVSASQNLNAEITVDNPTGDTTGTLTLRVLWPEELNISPVITGGGDCPGGGCDPGEYLSWDLGVLGPGADATVGFDETVRSNIVDGTLIPLEVELLEGGLPARNFGQTALVHPFDDFDNDGDADVFDPDDDNDGMPDWWEILHNLDPFDASDADEDPDMDGLTNLEEYLAGTDPHVHNFEIFLDGFESGDTSAWTTSEP